MEPTLIQNGTKIEPKRYQQKSFHPESLFDLPCGLGRRDIRLRITILKKRKYSEKMKVSLKNEKGKDQDLYMGCYGIGISRIVAASIEQNHDDKGIVWPYSIAPFHLNIICLDPSKKEILEECKSVYNILKKSGHDVLLDDRDIRAGIKFTEHEMLGIPFSIIIGPNANN